MSDQFLVWLPLLITVLTIIGGMFAYHFQKKKDRNDIRRHERRHLYRDLIGAVRLAEGKTLNEKWDAAYKHYEEWLTLEASLLISAPDDVALQLRELRKRYLIYHHTLQKTGYDHNLYLSFAEQFYLLLFEMRKDVFEQQRLSEDFNVGSFIEHLREANLGLENTKERLL